MYFLVFYVMQGVQNTKGVTYVKNYFYNSVFLQCLNLDYG